MAGALFRLAVRAWRRVLRRAPRPHCLSRAAGRTDRGGRIEGVGCYELRTPSRGSAPPAPPGHERKAAAMQREIRERFEAGGAFRAWAPVLTRGVVVAARIVRRGSEKTEHVVLLLPRDERRVT